METKSLLNMSRTPVILVMGKMDLQLSGRRMEVDFEEWIRRILRREMRDFLWRRLAKCIVLMFFLILLIMGYFSAFAMTTSDDTLKIATESNSGKAERTEKTQADSFKASDSDWNNSENRNNNNNSNNSSENNSKKNDENTRKNNSQSDKKNPDGDETPGDLEYQSSKEKNLEYQDSENQKNSEQQFSDINQNENIKRDLKEYVLGRESASEQAIFHAYLQDAGGTEIEPDEEDVYHVYENDLYYFNIHFYAPMGIPEQGIYQYMMPEGMKAVQTSVQTIRASDGAEIGVLEILDSGKVLSINMNANKKIRLNVTFSCTVEFDRENPAIKIESHRDGSISKTGYFNGLTGQFEWTITAQIPAYMGGKAKEWGIGDILYDPIEADAHYWSLDKIKQVDVVYDGVRYPLFDENIATEKNMDIAYKWDSRKKPARLFILNRTKADKCEGYCTHWYMNKSVKIIIYYVNSVDESSLWLKDVIDESTLQNDALLNNNRVTSEVTISPFFTKSHSSDFSKYTITLNPDFYDLSHQSIVIDDVMTGNAFYINGTMTALVTDKNGVTFPLQYGTDFTVEKVDGSAQHIRIHVANPSAYCYQFTYQTGAKDSEDVGEVKNEARVTLWGHEFQAEDYSFSSSAEEYFVRLKKSEQDFGKAVPGALYGLYSSAGELMIQGITDGLGECLFRGDPENGFLLDRNCLYYVQEIEAPDGYEKNEKKTWFYFEESDYETYICPLLEEAKFTGIYSDEDGEVIKTADGRNENLSEWILVEDRKIKMYTLPQTGGMGTDAYITVAFLMFAGAGSVFHIFSNFSGPVEITEDFDLDEKWKGQKKTRRQKNQRSRKNKKTE